MGVVNVTGRISFQENRCFILNKPTQYGGLAPQATTVSSMVSGKTPIFLVSQEALQPSGGPPLGVSAKIQPILKAMDLA